MIDRAQINLKGGPPVPGPGESLHLWPPLAGDPAPGVDHLFLYLLTVTVFFTLLVFVLIVFFALRYRRVPGRKAQQLPTARWLEVTWTVVPGLIVIGTFFWAAAQYVHMKQTPAGATRMYVVGKQWMWKIQHPTGKREINTLHVPVGQTIELTMTSEDTIHSFYLPAFRQKQDVLPGRYTTLWFKATTPGEYHLFCAEYCGTDHSKMGGKLVVMQPAGLPGVAGGFARGRGVAAAGGGGAVREQGLRRVPRPARADAGGAVRRDRQAGGRRRGDRGRGVPAGEHPQPVDEGRRRLAAADADVPGGSFRRNSSSRW